MNYYLTEKATKERKWDMAICVVSVLLGIVAVQAAAESFTMEDFSDFTTSLMASMIIVGAMLSPMIFVLVRRRCRKLAR